MVAVRVSMRPLLKREQGRRARQGPPAAGWDSGRRGAWRRCAVLAERFAMTWRWTAGLGRKDWYGCRRDEHSRCQSSAPCQKLDAQVE